MGGQAERGADAAVIATAVLLSVLNVVLLFVAEPAWLWVFVVIDAVAAVGVVAVYGSSLSSTRPIRRESCAFAVAILLMAEGFNVWFWYAWMMSV